jgi:hypothetical protein
LDDGVAGCAGSAVTIDHTNLRSFVAGERGPAIATTFLGAFAHYLEHVAGVPTGSSILQYLGEVATFCERQHLARPALPPLLRLALERKDAAAPVDNSRDPASKQFVASFLESGAVPSVCKVAAVLLWFGTFRGKEVLAQHVGKAMPLSLRRCDVAFAPDKSFVRISLRSGKPCERNQPTIRLITRPEDAGLLDPVAVLWDYVLRTSQFDDDGPFLRHDNGSYLTTAQMRATVQRHATALGLDSRRYGNHSFRSGGDTEMRAQGVDGADVLLQGGWRSERGDEPYRRPNVKQARRAQAALAIPRSRQAIPGTTDAVVVSASTPLLSAAQIGHRS